MLCISVLIVRTQARSRSIIFRSSFAFTSLRIHCFVVQLIKCSVIFSLLHQYLLAFAFIFVFIKFTHTHSFLHCSLFVSGCSFLRLVLASEQVFSIFFLHWAHTNKHVAAHVYEYGIFDKQRPTRTRTNIIVNFTHFIAACKTRRKFSVKINSYLLLHLQRL